MPELANHIFLPWVQPPVAAALPDSANETLTAAPVALVTLPVQITINTTKVTQSVRMYGPGDVTGIDPQQVIRLEPPARTQDFEPNYFAAIEFDRPDFPWLFTPLKADAQGRLRPWLCLVVVKKQTGVELRPGVGIGLPVLQIKSPASVDKELPDLAESHLWAHAQVTGVAKAQIGDALQNAPARNLSRLLCPRRLDPSSDYVACVVPSFKVGCKAGLDEPVADDEKLAPAWTSGTAAPAEVKLPVYYSWEFRTGEGGDFEELVRRLVPRELPPEVGHRPMNVGNPGFPLQPKPAAGVNTVLGLEGALRALQQVPGVWEDAIKAAFQNGLKPILNTPWQLATQSGGAGDPCVAPPIYGCWHAAKHEVATALGGYPQPAWLNELNLDPRQRAVAAMGTQVVNTQQEALMASAWEQLGQLAAINQRLRQAQLSRAVNANYHKTLTKLADDSFLRVVGPASHNITIPESTAPSAVITLSAKIASTSVPTMAFSVAARKLTRQNGGFNREYALAGVAGLGQVVQFFNARPASSPAQTRGAVTLDNIADVMATLFNAQGLFWVDATPTIPGHWERSRVGMREALTGFRRMLLKQQPFAPEKSPPLPLPGAYAALKQHTEKMQALFPVTASARLVNIQLSAEVKVAALTALDPARTVSRVVRAELAQTSPPSTTGDELEPVLDAPSFPQPMYEALRDLSQDYLFPGLEHVPPNTVQLLETNGAFIESFMVGLNNEMGRELLWRGYPTDQRGSYFQQFWAMLSPNPTPDIPPIHTWGNRALGMTARGVGGDRLVLLLRGELLKRYPGTIIYALQAGPAGKELTEPRAQVHPVFRGILNPDVTFLGFELTRAKIKADGNWYFIVQQQPTEPRFGLDDAPFGPGESGTIPTLSTWNDLNWAHLAPNADALKALSHLTVSKVSLAPQTTSRVTWGKNSAHMASITKQKAVRVAIHASELLPP